MSSSSSSSLSRQTPAGTTHSSTERAFPGLGVYPLLDHDVCLKRGLDPLTILKGWQDSGAVRYYQWRAKGLSEEDYLAVARKLRRAAPDLELFANDRLNSVLQDEAEAVEQGGQGGCFAGLHLGQDDLQELDAADLDRLGDLRARRPDFVLGLSTHSAAQIERAIAGQGLQIAGGSPNQFESGAGLWSYLALGPCFPTASKPTGRDPVLAAEELRRALEVLAGALADRNATEAFPLVLIGGINRTNIEELLNLYAGTAEAERIRPVVAGIESTLDAAQISYLGGKIQKYSS